VTTGVTTISRRTLLAAGGNFIVSALGLGTRFPVIDAHTHFYNPLRSTGRSTTAGVSPHLNLPEDYSRMVEPLGIRGTIVVESSPWVEDNQWLLDLARRQRIIVGLVGHLEPGTPHFREQLLRFHENPIFRGIRYGNLWGWDLGRALQRADFISDVKFLAETGLELDAVLDAPGSTPDLKQVVRLTDIVPSLRVVIDHLPFYPGEGAARAEYELGLRELSGRPQVWAKISGVLRQVGNRTLMDVDDYRPALDEMWEAFGPERLIYGSNWPVSDHLAPYDIVFSVVRGYFAAKGLGASKKFFCENSKRAYRWAFRS
jgi:L-fuconolactonase